MELPSYIREDAYAEQGRDWVDALQGAWIRRHAGDWAKSPVLALLPPDIRAQYMDFLRLALERDPVRRATPKQLLETPLMQRVAAEERTRQVALYAPVTARNAADDIAAAAAPAAAAALVLVEPGVSAADPAPGVLQPMVPMVAPDAEAAPAFGKPMTDVAPCLPWASPQLLLDAFNQPLAQQGGSPLGPLAAHFGEVPVAVPANIPWQPPHLALNFCGQPLVQQGSPFWPLAAHAGDDRVAAPPAFSPYQLLEPAPPFYGQLQEQQGSHLSPLLAVPSADPPLAGANLCQQPYSALPGYNQPLAQQGCPLVPLAVHINDAPTAGQAGGPYQPSLGLHNNAAY